MPHPAPHPIVPSVPVSLPRGATWLQRLTPDPQRYERWRTALQRVAAGEYADSARQRRLRAYERIALLAAYDGGWDVKGADGQVLPSPRRLSLRGWDKVPEDVIAAMLQHLDAQTESGLQALIERARQPGGMLAGAPPDSPPGKDAAV